MPYSSPFKVYNSVCNIATDLCNDDHTNFRGFSPPQKDTPYPLAITSCPPFSPCPPAQVATNVLLSLWIALFQTVI